MAFPVKPDNLPTDMENPVRGEPRAIFAAKANTFLQRLVDEYTPDLNALAEWFNDMGGEIQTIGENVEQNALDVANAQTATEGFRDEAETFKDSAEVAATNAANDVVDIINQTAISTANYKGVWSNLTGALNVPASVSEGSSVYLLLEGVADVTLWQPSLNPDKWLLIRTTLDVIETPTVTGINGNTIQFSSYGTLNNYYGTHERTRVQISANSDFSGTLLIDADILATESYTYTTETPATVWVRVAYGSNGFFSQYSISSEVTTTGFIGEIGIDLIEAGSSSDQFNSVTTDQDGNYVAVGYTSSAGAGGVDGWIVKFDSSLNKIAEYTLGGTGSDRFNSVTTDQDGNYVAVGRTDSAGAGSNDGWIVKFDSSLNKIAEYTLGGTGSDQFNSVTTDQDGNYVAVGSTSSAGAGSNDGWIVKFDSSLNKIAEYTLGGTVSDQFNSVTTDQDGNYVAVGYTSSAGAGGVDGWIVKFDSSLNKIAEYTLGGTVSDRFNSVTTDQDGNYVAVGYTSSAGAGSVDGWIVKFDSSLNKIAEYTLGGTGSDQFDSVTTDQDGNYVAVGYTSSAGAGGFDGWIVKFDSSLNKIAEYTLGGTGSDQFDSVTTDQDGAYVFIGYFNDGTSNNGVICRTDNALTMTIGPIANLPAYDVESQNQTYSAQTSTVTTVSNSRVPQNQTYSAQTSTYTAQTSTVTYSDL